MERLLELRKRLREQAYAKLPKGTNSTFATEYEEYYSSTLPGLLVPKNEVLPQNVEQVADALRVELNLPDNLDEYHQILHIAKYPNMANSIEFNRYIKDSSGLVRSLLALSGASSELQKVTVLPNCVILSVEETDKLSDLCKIYDVDYNGGMISLPHTDIYPRSLIALMFYWTVDL